MKTRAVRLYGKNDLRLEEFELPRPKDDGIHSDRNRDLVCQIDGTADPHDGLRRAEGDVI